MLTVGSVFQDETHKNDRAIIVLNFATYGNGCLTCSASDDDWRELKRQLLNADRRRQTVKDKLAREKAIAAKADSEKQRHADELKNRVELYTNPRQLQRTSVGDLQRQQIDGAEMIRQANEAIAMATTLGVLDRVMPDPFAPQDGETDKQYWERVNSVLDSEVTHDTQPQPNDHYPLSAAWRCPRVTGLRGEVSVYEGAIEHFAYHPPLLHYPRSGLSSLVNGEAKPYTMPVIPPDGGAGILNGHVNSDCLAGQYDKVMKTLLSRLVADLAKLGLEMPVIQAEPYRIPNSEIEANRREMLADLEARRLSRLRSAGKL